MKRRKKFNITEINGTESPYEWFAQKIQEYANEQYGMHIKVELINHENNTPRKPRT